MPRLPLPHPPPNRQLSGSFMWSSRQNGAWSTQQIIGIVLLGLGGLALVVFTVVGIFTGNHLLGLFLGSSPVLCGLICLLCRKNVGLKCAWAVYLPLWVLFTVFLTR